MNILFDIGGTKTKLASHRGGDLFDEPIVADTLKSYEEGLEFLIEKIEEISGGEKIDSVVGGIAGPWDRKKQILIESPNLPHWVGKPFKETLEKKFNCKVIVENDAAMVGLGEAHFGAGKGHSIVVYITVSTGVGGARIVDGKIDEKIIGFEPGHQIIDMDKTLIPEALGTDLESMIGGKWVEKRMGKRPSEITDENFWEEMARILAVGLNNTIVHWSPNIVVLGGSMMNKIGVPIERVESHLRQMVKIYPELPKVVRAELGETGGLYGAIAYLQGNGI